MPKVRTYEGIIQGLWQFQGLPQAMIEVDTSHAIPHGESVKYILMDFYAGVTEKFPSYMCTCKRKSEHMTFICG